MQPNELVNQLKSKLEEAKTHFKEELAKIRTGRAHAGVLDKLMVNAYGVSMPIKQVANVTAPEAQLLQITPFDPGNLQAIASAVREDQSLGLNPVDDGAVIRITVPPLTTERRAEIVKQISSLAENAAIAMRNARHEIMKEVEQSKKNRQITEDDQRSTEKQIDELMTNYKNEVDQLVKAKEQDVMTI
jgi:ribosome recycling factor